MPKPGDIQLVKEKGEPFSLSVRYDGDLVSIPLEGKAQEWAQEYWKKKLEGRGGSDNTQE